MPGAPAGRTLQGFAGAIGDGVAKLKSECVSLPPCYTAFGQNIVP